MSRAVAPLAALRPGQPVQVQHRKKLSVQSLVVWGEHIKAILKRRPHCRVARSSLSQAFVKADQRLGYRVSQTSSVALRADHCLHLSQALLNMVGHFRKLSRDNPRPAP